MYQTNIADLDLFQIYESGQTFRWRRLDEDAYAVPAFGRLVVIRRREEGFEFSCDRGEYDSVWMDYLDGREDYSAIKRLIRPSDLYLKDAAGFGGGIRILRQDLWETMVSFVISQNNNIPRIRNSIEALCERFGERRVCREAGNYEYATFPGPDVLAEAKENEYAGLGLGYRDKYICRLAKAVAGGELSLERFAGMEYEKAHRTLMAQYGIGRKVADCICLFGLHHIDTFPIDTHIRRILASHYPDGFPLDVYRGYNGIMQQYLFYFARSGHS